MKTIIHIGSPKTGTTALQRNLFHSREELLSKGVLYPVLTHAEKSKNHGPIAMQLLPQQRLPRLYRFMSKQDIKSAAKSTIQELQYQITKTKPECLLLSSEYFFRVMPNGAWSDFFAELGSIDDQNLSISCYIRRPSRLYLSIVQQKLKASHEVLQPRIENFRRVLERYQQVFPEAKISVRPFEREQMVDGDIFTDFVSEELGQFGVGSELVANLEADTSEANTSLSAESMDILRNFRKTFYPYENEVYNPSTTQLVRKLAMIERALEIPKPKLDSGIAEIIDHLSEDILWLRENFGINFPGIDYNKVGEAYDALARSKELELRDIISIDAEAEKSILDRLKNSHWEKKDKRFGMWIADLKESLAS